MHRSFPSPSPRLLRLLTPAALAALALAPAASGQVDFPERTKSRGAGTGKAAPGQQAAALACTVCGTRNTETPIDWSIEIGYQDAYCRVCQTTRLHQMPRRGEGAGRGLDLPSDPRKGADRRAAEAESADPIVRALEDAPRPNTQGEDRELGRAAKAILAELVRADVEAEVVRRAPDTLLALGESGRSAARLALASDEAPMVLTGLRVLLRGGDPRDADAVVRRLELRLPPRHAAMLVSEFVQLDPVHATPRVLLRLLSHDQSSARLAAFRYLTQTTIGPDLLPDLERALHASSSDTRGKALELLARVDDPAALDPLLDLIDDPRAEVAKRAVEIVARREEPVVEQRLMELAFGERWILRSSAFALLAILEREDVTLRPVLHGGHVEALLRGLVSNDELVSSACAASLASIGFRTEATSDDPGAGSLWMDDVVPQRLVEVVAGFQFFEDYEAVRDVAERRLASISGQAFASNGPAWAEWWVGAREGFHALRAVLPAPEGAESGLRVAVVDPEGDGSFVLLGPDEAASGAGAREGEPFYVTVDEARDLLDVLRDEGALSVERLPGARGARLDAARTLEVVLDGRSKRFTFAQGLAEPWFDRVFGAALAVRERNLWQRYPDPSTHGDRLGLFTSESGWWAEHHDPTERLQRRKDLVLARLRSEAPTDREPTLEALLGLYADGAADPADLDALLAVLAQEQIVGRRAQRMGQALRRAAGLHEAAPAPDAPLDPLVAGRATFLVDRWIEQFGDAALGEVGVILSEAGRAFTRGVVADERPSVRAVAALALGDAPTDQDVELLIHALDDRAPEVVIAAISALGRARAEEARDELTVRATLGRPEVRDEALVALGRLGGEDARDILVTTLTSPELDHRLAAARGLAELADPETSSLLISMLRGGATDDLASALRTGLERLGPAAHDDLFAAMRSPSASLRREAALMLARQLVPGAAPGLMRALAEDPADAEVGRELCILSCVDHRDAIDPAEAWYRWWDGVRHDDSTAWLRAAGEAHGIAAPPAEAFEGTGTRDAIGFLVQVMREDQDYVAERARRELARCIGRDPGPLPDEGRERDLWLGTLLEVLEGTR